MLASRARLDVAVPICHSVPFSGDVGGNRMRRLYRYGFLSILGTAGCASVPPVDNPALVQPGCVENPVLLAPGLPTPDGYAATYERVLDAVDDYFDIKPGSRYSGRIETVPRTAPGYEQPTKPGSPDRYERLLATFQSIRHRGIIEIQAGERGGYLVYVEVLKELEALPQPTLAVAGPAAFRQAPIVPQRQSIVNADAVEGNWIPLGRDVAMEQAILRRIQSSGRR